MSTVYLLLGTNLGNKQTNISAALDKISTSIGVITKQSSVYETAAWGNTNQDSFYNLVVSVETPLAPQEVLIQIFNIEKSLGRVREVKWEPRIIDIDILYYDDCIIETELLVVPHPLLHKRRFTLLPLVEIAPNFKHPISAITNHDLLKQCDDNLPVVQIGTFDKPTN